MGDRDTREHKEQADALGCTSYASYDSTPLATVVYFMAACGILPLAIRHPREPDSPSRMPEIAPATAMATAARALAAKGHCRCACDSGVMIALST